MHLPVKNSSKRAGFTLIEVMMAMLVMTVGIMALIQTLGYAIAQNFSNKLRNDAVLIAGSAMETERIKPFNSMASARSIKQVPFALGYVNYSVVENVTRFSSYTSARIQITVSWRDKSVRKYHSLTTIVSH